MERSSGDIRGCSRKPIGRRTLPSLDDAIIAVDGASVSTDGLLAACVVRTPVEFSDGGIFDKVDDTQEADEELAYGDTV